MHFDARVLIVLFPVLLAGGWAATRVGMVLLREFKNAAEKAKQS